MTTEPKPRRMQCTVLLPELAVQIGANHVTLATVYERDVLVFVTFSYTEEQHATGSLLTGDYQPGQPTQVDVTSVELLSGGDLGIEDDDTFKLKIKTDTDLMPILTRLQMMAIEDEVLKRARAGQIE